MGLINWNSDPKKIAETVAEEVPYALRWLTKKTSNRECRQQLMRLAEMAITTGEAQCLPTVVEYTSKSGNKWLTVVAVDKSGYMLDCLMMYGLTERYMWAATLMNSTYDAVAIGGANEVALFTPHFFQRLYERVGIKQDDRLVALRNFLMLVRMMPVRVEDSRRIRGGKDVFGRLKGCVCYGHMKGKVLYFNTVLPERHMSIGNMIRTKGFREMSDSEYTTVTELISDAFNQENPVKWVRSRCKMFSLGKRMDSLLTCLVGLRLVFSRMIGEYRCRVSVLQPYDREAGENLLNEMIDEFYNKSLIATYENIQPWLSLMVKATHKEVNPMALASAICEVAGLCGEGVVDYDKFYYKQNNMLDRLSRGRIL